MIPGEKIWTREKSKFVERVVRGTAPYHIYTELLPGEPTSNPKTGMFITFHSHLILEVGRTKQECIQNRMKLERQRINLAKQKVKKHTRRLEKYYDIFQNLEIPQEPRELEVGMEVRSNIHILGVTEEIGIITQKRFADHKPTGTRIYEARFKDTTYIFRAGELREK